MLVPHGVDDGVTAAAVNYLELVRQIVHPRLNLGPVAFQPLGVKPPGIDETLGSDGVAGILAVLVQTVEEDLIDPFGIDQTTGHYSSSLLEGQ